MFCTVFITVVFVVNTLHHVLSYSVYSDLPPLAINMLNVNSELEYLKEILSISWLWVCKPPLTWQKRLRCIIILWFWLKRQIKESNFGEDREKNSAEKWRNYNIMILRLLLRNYPISYSVLLLFSDCRYLSTILTTWPWTSSMWSSRISSFVSCCTQVLNVSPEWPQFCDF